MNRFPRKTGGKRRAWQTVRHLGGIVVPDELTVCRILGDQPFAEIGRPVWAVTDERHGCVIAAGDLGHVMWRGTGHWLGHRIGVYEAGTLRPRHVVASRYSVCAIEPHPELPLVAVGTGRYDGSWDFQGQLLLLHLETGRVTNLLSKSRQVRHLRWLEDGRLAMLLSPRTRTAASARASSWPSRWTTGCLLRPVWSTPTTHAIRWSRPGSFTTRVWRTPSRG